MHDFASLGVIQDRFVVLQVCLAVDRRPFIEANVFVFKLSGKDN